MHIVLQLLEIVGCDSAPVRIALEAERHRKGDVGSEIHSGPDAEIVGHMGREVEAEAGAADRDSDIKMAENIALLCSERHLSFPVAILRMNRAHKKQSNNYGSDPADNSFCAVCHADGLNWFYFLNNIYTIITFVDRFTPQSYKILPNFRKFKQRNIFSVKTCCVSHIFTTFAT